MGPSVLHMKCLLPRAHPSGALNTRRFLHEEVLRHGGLPTVSSLPEFVHFRHFVSLDRFGNTNSKGFVTHIHRNKLEYHEASCWQNLHATQLFEQQFGSCFCSRLERSPRWPSPGCHRLDSSFSWWPWFVTGLVVRDHGVSAEEESRARKVHERHGCCWERLYIFAYCALVGNSTTALHFTAKKNAPLPTSTKKGGLKFTSELNYGSGSLF